MPTGYTAKLCEKGQTFREYALTCARAFGALILMRDDPLDAPIPDKFGPSTYAEKTLAEYKARLEQLSAMTEAESATEGERLRAEAIAVADTCLAKEQAQSARLLAMKAEVEAWTPPTSEHEGLKRFMLEQIEVSDPSTEWVEEYAAEAKAKTAAEYFANAVDSARRMATTYTDQVREEIERASSRTEWVRRLRESLQ